MEIISRQEAKRRGLGHYFTGKPCRRGHMGKRRVSDWSCVICKLENGRKSRSTDPERFREHSRRYMERNREQELKRQRESKRRRYVIDRETILSRNRAWGIKKRTTKLIRNRRRRAAEKLVENSLTAADWNSLVARSPRCHWCKRRFTNTRKPTHDHVVPIIEGGANTLENSVCSCGGCNSRKRDRLINPVTGQGILL